MVLHRIAILTGVNVFHALLFAFSVREFVKNEFKMNHFEWCAMIELTSWTARRLRISESQSENIKGGEFQDVRSC